MLYHVVLEEMEESNYDQSSFNQMLQNQMDAGIIQFLSGNPAVELLEGKIHLFGQSSEERGTICCVFCVPAYCSPSEFTRMIGHHFKSVSHMRIVRHNGMEERYMVLLKFIDQESADRFHTDFNGKPFSSMEPDRCLVLYVASIQFSKPLGEGQSAMIPPFESSELPSCPVCLERLDETSSGILTILCNHSFHGDCLSNCKDDSCPVCRYCQQPEAESPMCSKCRATQSLWICLICGNLGCGRYVNSHSKEHYNETQHRYSLELETSRVWDYLGDRYVHRLAINKSDGKLVIIEGNNNNNNNANDNPHQEVDEESSFPENKVQSISLEFTHIIETQTRYFEQKTHEKELKIRHQEEEFAHLLHQNEEMRRVMDRIKEERKNLESKNKMLETKMKEMEKAGDVLERKLKEERKENDFLNQICKNLRQNQDQLNSMLEAEKKGQEDSKTKKIRELEEQIQDLMSYFEMQKQIDENEELKDGKIVLGAINPQQQIIVESPSKGKSPSRRGRKKG